MFKYTCQSLMEKHRNRMHTFKTTKREKWNWDNNNKNLTFYWFLYHYISITPHNVLMSSSHKLHSRKESSYASNPSEYFSVESIDAHLKKY